jgi:CheY-like chemotaxis protein
MAALPIIAISASVTEEDQDNSLLAGVDAFMTKPVHQNGLLETLGRLLKVTLCHDEAAVTTDSAAVTGALTPPPRAQLEQLYRLAREGDMRAIRQLADDMESADARHLAFARLLRQLAKEYQSKALLELAQHYVENAP